jgi:uncharacterized Zn finger protein
MPSELKPCKYCGGEAELVRVGDNKEYLAYQCSKCGNFHARRNEARRTPFAARRVWNRRATNDL